MKRSVAIAFLAFALASVVTAQPVFCGSKAILPDDTHMVPGLKFTGAPSYTGYALMSLYLSPDDAADVFMVAGRRCGRLQNLGLRGHAR